ncbi:MAG: hypothetical protein EPO40_18320 [Myxococcaceae bacterium]|nr:MAG: hypothetical protein EPO40_18320 [Myxococcaceae bacterium]
MTRLPQRLAAALLALCGCDSREVPAFSDDPESVRQGYMLGIDVPGAWRVERGRPEVVVAVIDNGFDVAHPDLRAQLWTNPAEVAGDGLDNDGNGYVDDLHGWNFLARSARVSLDEADGVAPALWSHGTAAAGIIAASTGNGLGVASCCPGCRWMPLVARDFRTARTVLPRLPEALAYAVRNRGVGGTPASPHADAHHVGLMLPGVRRCTTMQRPHAVPLA